MNKLSGKKGGAVFLILATTCLLIFSNGLSTGSMAKTIISLIAAVLALAASIGFFTGKIGK